jgi:hypothetical protein
MDAAAKHTQVLTARQIQKTLQGRLAARLSTLQAALFSGDPTLPAPAVASYWIAPMWKQPPGAVYSTPSIGVQWEESETVSTSGNLSINWLTSTSYRIVIGTTGETPQLALEVAQAYASAVSQLLAGYLKLDGEAAGASSTSLGESIPIRVATPVGTAVGTPPWFGDASTEALILSEVVIEVTQHEVMR